ncbi:SusC/RagA family TonB-linked outer membrane protein [Autumnicola psychrophila]|uniref:TonB-dependent receptor n=1 Tax=Autumnicola psychrophila TaxID=3075592 RepID=A0ABU3DN70_9FLAO|nr:TonB-dependent receptor [Zunongwangia sp. F225]MDT0684974.1 TonB-dependent receptor [Zunongwangia sp. F225]
MKKTTKGLASKKDHENHALSRAGKVLLVFVFLLFVCNNTFAFKELPQENTVTGTVTDANGIPLPAVNVIEKGTTNGTQTDFDGNYSLNVSSSEAVLVFSFVGMAEYEQVVGTSSEIDIVLEADAAALEEVVVVGYGTQRKSTMTGSVSTLSGSDVAENPVANISQSLAGRMAGVSMRPNGGQPGMDSPQIQIRGIGTTGSSAPLIVVDGIIRDNIAQIDPNSIESMSVLKDAAAVAPYGLGGANGVVLITTKKGKSGAPQLTLNAYYGIQTPTYDYYDDLLNSQQYMRLRNEAFLNENNGQVPEGSQLPFDPDVISNYNQLRAEDPDRYPQSNPTEYTSMTAPMQNYNIQLSGGSENTRYYAGIGYFDQGGYFDPMSYNRYNYNMNLQSQVTSTTEVSLSVIGSIEKTESVDPEETASGLFRSGFKFIPIRNIYYSNGLWGEFAGRSPVAILQSGGYARNNNNTLLTSISVDQKLSFLEGLSFTGKFSYDPNQRTIKNWHRPFYFYSQNLNTDPYEYAEEISANEGNAVSYTYLEQEYIKNETFTYQAMLNYQNTFGLHDVSGLLVAEARNNTYETFNARRNNFAVNVDELGMGSSDRNDYDNYGTSETGSQIGYVYRFTYAYNDRYLFEATGRYDGHYFFAPGKRYGYFPAFAAGWRISEESFMNDIDYIQNLKLRGSWGKSGNLAGSAFQYQQGYSIYGNAYAFGPGRMVQGSYVPLEANPNLTWEIATKFDIGLDASLWNRLLTLEVDYFSERRTGMLLPPAVSVPAEYGLDLSEENAGVMESHGFEFVIGSNYTFENGLLLGIDGNFSYSTNEMVEVFETAATFDNPNRRRTGRAFDTPFGYKSLGLFTTSDDVNNDGIINSADGYEITQFGDLHPGDIRYADLSGPEGVPDGVIDAHDETVIGNPAYPGITYGLTTNASWKGFDMSLFFQGSAMMSFDLNQSFHTLPFANNSSNTTTEYYNNRWTPETENARYPRATQSPYANNTQTSDFWMVDSKFVRLKTAQLGYTLPVSLTETLGIQSARFYVTGQNLFTISELDFIDPEAGFSNQNGDDIDRETAYPNSKVYTFGFDINF